VQQSSDSFRNSVHLKARTSLGHLRDWCLATRQRTLAMSWRRVPWGTMAEITAIIPQFQARRCSARPALWRGFAPLDMDLAPQVWRLRPVERVRQRRLTGLRRSAREHAAPLDHHPHLDLGWTQRHQGCLGGQLRYGRPCPVVAGKILTAGPGGAPLERSIGGRRGASRWSHGRRCFPSGLLYCGGEHGHRAGARAGPHGQASCIYLAGT